MNCVIKVVNMTTLLYYLIYSEKLPYLEKRSCFLLSFLAGVSKDRE